MNENLLYTTMNSIGDAVIATDPNGLITFMNPVAVRLTGWHQDDALGRKSTQVFYAVNEAPRTDVETPVDRVIRTGVVVGPANHKVLLAKDGREIPIEYSAAPIRSEGDTLFGVVVVFRDVTERKLAEIQLQSAREYTDSIVETVRQPLLVLNEALRVVSANRAYVQTFNVTLEHAVGRLIFDLGNGEWNIPALRTLLEDILPTNSHFDNYKVAHDFELIGRRTIVLNARRMIVSEGGSALILLAMEDVTESTLAKTQLEVSEVRYRRLFEAARDGILILDPVSATVTESNPFMTELLGYSRDELVGKELADIGLFRDRSAARAAMHALKESGYIRYEDLPLEAKSGLKREVEFVSNVYREGDRDVIQCNIRDITDRTRAEETLRTTEVEVGKHVAEIERLNASLQLAMAETHHRVKNNLQVICALVDMQTMAHEQVVPVDELVRIGHHIRSLSAIHDLLTQRVKAGGDSDLVSTSDAMGKLAPLLRAMVGNRQLLFDIEDIAVPLRCGTTLAVLVNELVSNAVKHGRGDIAVGLHAADGQVILDVSDNGGFPSGFEPATMAHTGLELIESLSRLDLRGTVSYDNRTDGGARVSVRFPSPAVVSGIGAQRYPH